MQNTTVQKSFKARHYNTMYIVPFLIRFHQDFDGNLRTFWPLGTPIDLEQLHHRHLNSVIEKSVVTPYEYAYQ